MGLFRWGYCGRCNRFKEIKGLRCATCEDALRKEA